MPGFKICVRTDRLHLGQVVKGILIISCLLSLGACNMASLAGNPLKTEAMATNKAVASPATESAAPIEPAPTLGEAAPPQPIPLLTAANENNVIISPAGPMDASVAIQAVVSGSASEPAEAVVGGLGADEQEFIEVGLIDQNSCIRGLPGQLVTGLAGQNLIAVAASADSDTPLFMNMALLTEDAAAESAPSAGTATSPQKTAIASDIQAKTATKAATGTFSLKAGVTETLLAAAYEQTGRPFKNGGQTPGTGFDAAGYTYWVFHEKGINLPQGAKRQADNGRQVARDELRPGDILVYRDPGINDGSGGYHVGIYTGQGNFLHAAPKTGVVTETAAFSPQFSPYFVGGRRYYDDPKASPLSDEQKMIAASTAVKLALSELGPNDKLVKNIKKPADKKAKKTKKK